MDCLLELFCVVDDLSQPRNIKLNGGDVVYSPVKL